MDENLRTRAEQLIAKLDLDGKRKSIREIETLSSHPDFWKDTQAAAKKMRKNG